VPLCPILLLQDLLHDALVHPAIRSSQPILFGARDLKACFFEQQPASGVIDPDIGVQLMQAKGIFRIAAYQVQGVGSQTVPAIARVIDQDADPGTLMVRVEIKQINGPGSFPFRRFNDQAKLFCLKDIA